MAILRSEFNPIITPKDVKPSREGYEVIGAFNAAVTRHNGDVVLLIRVAERPININPDLALVPIFNVEKNELEILTLEKSNPDYDFSDSRDIKSKNGLLLTSISHLRLARSKDGVNFIIDEKPALFPANEYEAYGIEDSRITFIDGRYYINYGAISKYGLNVALASTTDFINYERHGIMFCPDNKDVTIFPEKINGKYYALHRPSISWFAKPEIWIAESNDLLTWGNHKRIAGLLPDRWDSHRMGASAVPFKTEHGWIEIYHGVSNNVYAIGAMLLDEKEPWKVIARSQTPLMTPETDYETNGFWSKVIFPCGALFEDGIVKLYYGGADAYTAYAEIPLNDILKNLNL